MEKEMEGLRKHGKAEGDRGKKKGRGAGAPGIEPGSAIMIRWGTNTPRRLPSGCFIAFCVFRISYGLYIYMVLLLSFKVHQH
jgi:hypothetical protein